MYTHVISDKKGLTWFRWALLARLVLGADHRGDDGLPLSVHHRAHLDRHLGQRRRVFVIGGKRVDG